MRLSSLAAAIIAVVFAAGPAFAQTFVKPGASTPARNGAAAAPSAFAAPVGIPYGPDALPPKPVNNGIPYGPDVLLPKPATPDASGGISYGGDVLTPNIGIPGPTTGGTPAPAGVNAGSSAKTTSGFAFH